MTHFLCFKRLLQLDMEGDKTMKSDFLIAVTQLMSERGLPQTKVLAAVEDALVSAYKKDAYTDGYDITVRLNPGAGTIDVYVQKVVSEKVEDEKREITLKDALEVNPEAALGDIIIVDAPFQSMGRIAAQTAKQVVLQRLREAERELVLEEYVGRIGEILPGRVERIESPNIVVGLGKTEAILPREEQVSYEKVRIGTTMQFYLVDVATAGRGPEVILSRSHRDLVTRLFEREVPEIQKGIVEIRAVAREPGSRTKVAVFTAQEGVDPVGSCVGLRGFRIQTIVNELQGEKIDVVQWSENTGTFLASALSPAQVLYVDSDPEERLAKVVVPDRQLSLAIGKEGQNARLTARLTGWKIEIKSQSEYEEQLALLEQSTESTESSVKEIPESEIETDTIEAETIEEIISDIETSTTVPDESSSIEELVVSPIDSADIASELAELGIEDLDPDTELIKSLEDSEIDSVQEDSEEIISPDDDSIWVLPDNTEQAEPSALRFAEDILPDRGRGDSRGRRGNKKSRRDRSSEPEV